MKTMTFLTFVSLFWVFQAGAAIPVQQAAAEKTNHYIEGGVVVGGYDQGPVTLANVRHSYAAKDKLERLVFDVEALSLEKKGLQRPGFFHIAVQKRQDGISRLVIDLEDFDGTKVSERQVSQILEKSKNFRSAQFFKDAIHKHLTIEIPMKSLAKIEVFELASQDKPGRIVIDAKGQ